MSMRDLACRQEIAEAARRAFAQKLFAGTSGNLSLYLREADKIFITPSGVRYEALCAEDIMVMRPDGAVLAGPHTPSSEWQLHTAIYRHFPEICAVVHTHSPYATAFAVNRAPIPAALMEMFPFLGGQVDCAPYARSGTPEAGLAVLPALAGKGGCLMANHGVVAIGRDLPEAYIRAEYLEDAAKIYTLAKTIGEPVILRAP